ncbi:MAG TPA: condensation domain-containing protein [Rhizomicrobium sp.]|jgi:hypothetical protein
MSIPKLVSGLESRGIILFREDGELRYRSPKGALLDVDKGGLRAHRDEVAAYLSAREAARALRAARGAGGPLIPSIAQEMWRQFAGGAEEGKPIALNIGMVGTFRRAGAEAVTRAIRTVVARHDVLRATFCAQAGQLTASLNEVEAFEIEQMDLCDLSPENAAQASTQQARQFCAQLNLIEGLWLTRAMVIALPGNDAMAVISCGHMVADAGTRNIILDELREILEGRPPAPSVSYNEFSRAERDFLASPRGDTLINYWRGWYDGQPLMKAPGDGTPLIWGNGIRIVCNFTIPKSILDRVRAQADVLKVTPFLIYLTIFSVAIARWSGVDSFPLRVLGDKRTMFDLSNTVGLMFCADAIAIDAPPDRDFEAIMRGILTEYDAALSMRIPTLHYWPPHCVRPGIEAPDFPNRLPAVFNYYSAGTARERAEHAASPGVPSATAWPPEITTLPPQTWPRRSAPLFLHLMDFGYEMSASLHFYRNVVSEADQQAFTAMLFRVFDESI